MNEGNRDYQAYSHQILHNNLQVTQAGISTFCYAGRLLCYSRIILVLLLGNPSNLLCTRQLCHKSYLFLRQDLLLAEASYNARRMCTSKCFAQKASEVEGNCPSYQTCPQL